MLGAVLAALAAFVGCSADAIYLSDPVTRAVEERFTPVDEIVRTASARSGKRIVHEELSDLSAAPERLRSLNMSPEAPLFHPPILRNLAGTALESGYVSAAVTVGGFATEPKSGFLLFDPRPGFEEAGGLAAELIETRPGLYGVASVVVESDDVARLARRAFRDGFLASGGDAASLAEYRFDSDPDVEDLRRVVRSASEVGTSLFLLVLPEDAVAIASELSDLSAIAIFGRRVVGHHFENVVAWVHTPVEKALSAWFESGDRKLVPSELKHRAFREN